ncbi:MAG: polyprenol monophosphomannose synthase [Streptosporangiaceae bacterium]|jgi:dolichol-phosphate mannosyltransferase
MATTGVKEDTALPQEWAATPLTVVMPTYNEAGSLATTCERVLSLPLPGLRLKVVDDNSPDGTGELAEQLALQADGRMSVLHRPGKEGLGRAYADGMAQAVAEGARYVLQMDADGSHPAEVISQLLREALATDSSLVVGSRYISGGSLGEDWPVHRRLLSGWANWYAARVLGLRLRDITAGFVLWRADVLPGILAQTASTGYSFQVETKYLALRAGQSAVEVPIRFGQRQAGASKMSLSVQLESALLPWRLRLRRGS